MFNFDWTNRDNRIIESYSISIKSKTKYAILKPKVNYIYEELAYQYISSKYVNGFIRALIVGSIVKKYF